VEDGQEAGASVEVIRFQYPATADLMVLVVTSASSRQLATQLACTGPGRSISRKRQCIISIDPFLLTVHSRANTQGLTAGGLAGLFWSLVWCYAGQSFIVLSLAEMASMAPVKKKLAFLMNAYTDRLCHRQQAVNSQSYQHRKRERLESLC
jgi:hypothetical protein